MIAIVDSGSTKADWIFSDGKTRQLLNSPGMNPNFIGEEDVVKIVSELAKSVSTKDVSKIFYFGTGCSSKEQRAIISGGLKKVFPDAEVNVDHDVMGAAIATCGNEKGIACIIGTGSNSIYFDGTKTHENNYGLGYILADEGAGTYLGKKLITNYLYGLLPESLSTDFKKKYNLSRQDVISNVYGNPTANTWLGSFASFYDSHKDNSWIRSTIKDGFEEFLQLFVMNYEDYEKIPVHFIGSIAYHHKDLLAEVMMDMNLVLGKVIQKPIDDLAEYFIGKNFLVG